MKKTIELSNGRLLIETDNNGYVPFTSIKKAYIDNGNIKKIITFSMWDDFQFDAYTKDNVNELFFEFDIGYFIYLKLSILFSKDKDIVIDDDHTFSNLK